MNLKKSKHIIVLIPILAAFISMPYISEYLHEYFLIKNAKDYMGGEIEYAKKYIENDDLKNAISHCSSAMTVYNNLTEINKKKLNEEYLTIQYLLGVSYYSNSICSDRYSDRRNNLEKAIGAFEESISCKSDVYNDALNNLSIAYYDLSQITDIKSNLYLSKKHIDSFLNISKNKDLNNLKHNITYAHALVRRGIIYSQLSEVEYKMDNLNKSMNDYEAAMRLVGEINKTYSEKYNTEIGIISSNLGNTYGSLSEIVNPVENLQKSEQYNKYAIQILKNNSSEFADALNNLGAFYLAKYNYLRKSSRNYDHEANTDTESQDCLDEAVRSFDDSSRHQSNCRLEKIDAIANLEFARMLCSSSSSNYNEIIDKSINKYKIIINEYNKTKCPIVYMNMNNYLGQTYLYKARISKDRSDIIKSIECYNESLDFWRRGECSLYFAEASMNIGIAYRELGKMEKSEPSLEKAKFAFENASEAWKLNQCPRDYAYSEYHLGKTYLDMYKINKDYLIADKALCAFGNSLRFFSKNLNDYPTMITLINEYINETKYDGNTAPIYH